MVSPTQQRVHIYADSRPPTPNANGPGLTICSEIQAFLDLGCAVEFINIRTKDHLTSLPCGYFKQLQYSEVDACDVKASCFTRLAYWVGRPMGLSFRQLFPARNIIRREVEARTQQDASAIHVFHYMETANVIPALQQARAIWAFHDIESEYVARRFAIDQELEQRRPYGWENRVLRRLSMFEREVARKCGLLLCVSREDAERITKEWKMPHAAYLPASIAYRDTPLVSKDRGTDGKLRLMHIGFWENPATYTSLEFLFTKVFTLLDSDTLSRLTLEVAGDPSLDSASANAILEMAKPYPMVRFLGRVDDIRSVYRRNDLQVVASTAATGRRARVIESWAFGMPVLCTTVGAGGVEYLAPGENILIADDPGEFARHLRELIHETKKLDEIAAAARKTYETNFSREAVATALRQLLDIHFGLKLPLATVSE
jgi:glycosyltransferase involved in cell wall biosynthesis